LLAFGAVLAVGISPARAGAQTKQACADAYIAGQVAQKEGRLREARASFEVCAADACPAALKKDCKPWRAQLDMDIPTLAVTVTDAAGAPIAGAVSTVDGAPLAASRPVPLDPGAHVVRVEASGMAPVERRVTLAAGDRNHPLAIVLAPAGAPAGGAVSSGVTRPVPVGPIVVGAVGLAAIGVFAGLGAAGNARKADLDALMCKPNCSPSAVSTARSLYLGADVSLGVGLAAVVAAGIWLGVKLGAPAPPAGTVSFSPSRGGGALTFHF
jgi:hypothetical protein